MTDTDAFASIDNVIDCIKIEELSSLPYSCRLIFPFVTFIFFYLFL